MDKKKSNFEFLRILSMIMIILHHFSVHSEWNFPLGVTLPKFVVQLLSIGGKVGVNCFILISGYFLCKSSFKLKSLRNIWLNTLFYSIFITLCFLFFDHAKINVVNIIRSLFPILTSTYWFITAYILLYLCVPYLNLLIKNMDEKLYKRLLVGFFLIFSFIQNITQIEILGSNLLWFIFLYFLGGYIRLYFHKDLTKANLYIVLNLLLFLDLLVLLFLDLLSYYFSFLGGKETAVFSSNQGIFPLFIALFLFLIIKNLNFKYNEFVNKIASTTFSVYLIHEHPLIRNLLWEEVMIVVNKDSSLSIIILGLGFSVVIFVLCSLIDLLKQTLFKKVLQVQKLVRKDGK